MRGNERVIMEDHELLDERRLMMAAKPKLSQPCPCGSGKKYKQCCAVKEHSRRQTARKTKRTVKWIAVVAVLGAIVYGLSQMSGVPFDEQDIGVVDFSVLDDGGKRTALRAANAARCTCGCGMTLAQCVATDSTCPIRERNVQRINTIVEETKAASR